MPFVDISIAEGRSPDSVRRLVTAVTDAVQDSLDAPRDTVRVIVREVSLDHWANGGVTLREKRNAQTVKAETNS